MSSIAFDLDGVLITDFDHIPNLGGLTEFYRMSVYCRPIFEPAGQYDIITARKPKYKQYTEQWIHCHLENKPDILFHDITHHTPEGYKAQVLNSHPEIRTYVESEPSIVEYLKVHVTTGCEIILFKEFILQKLS